MHTFTALSRKAGFSPIFLSKWPRAITRLSGFVALGGESRPVDCTLMARLDCTFFQPMRTSHNSLLKKLWDLRNLDLPSF